MEKFGSLHEFLRARSDAIIERWRVRVLESLGAEDLSRSELVNAMPGFVAELVAALAPADNSSALPEGSRAAPHHGRERLRAGFDVDQVIREYGLLGDVILEAVNDLGGQLSAREARLLLTSLHAGAAEAVAEYVRRRDDEARQQNARHLGFVAHELRSPLSAAWTALGIVRRIAQSPARAIELLDTSLTRLRELIDQVLVAGRLEAGVEPHYAAVELDELLRQIQADVTPEVEDRGLALTGEVPHGLRLEGDERLLRSALGNLVRNAVKFSRAGGTVAVRGCAEGPEVVIEVEDSCGGLPAGVAAELFEPFVQRGTDRSGLGLGLAIARQAIEAHGGAVELRDRPGKGCLFTIRLPAARPEKG